MSNNSKFFFNTLPFILTLCLPFFLVTGPFLSDLSISICCIIFLINSYKNKLIKYYKIFFVKFFIVFNLILICSSVISDYPLFSIKSSLFYFRFGLFALSVWYLIDTNKNFIKFFFISILITFVILTLDGYFQYIFNKDLIGLIPHKDFHSVRISSFFGSELILGSYMSRLFPLFFGLFVFYFYNKKKNLYFFLFYFLFLLIYFLVFLTGERTAFFIINFLIIYILFFINCFKKITIFFFSFLLLIFAFILYLKPDVGNRVIKYTFSQFKKQKEVILFSSMHTGHYKTGIKMFLDNKIFGIGPNNFRKMCNEKKYITKAYADSGDIQLSACATHPHNIYVQLLAETGILGFGLILSLYLHFMYLLIKNFLNKYFLKTIDFKMSILGGFIITLFPLIPSGNFFNNYINIIYYLPLGFYLWLANSKAKI